MPDKRARFSACFAPFSAKRARPPRYPRKTTVSRRRITQTWRKFGDFATVT
jgi:hypothetical protein